MKDFLFNLLNFYVFNFKSERKFNNDDLVLK